MAKKSTGRATRSQPTPGSLKTAIRKLDREIVKLLAERASRTIDLLATLDDPHRILYDPASDAELWDRLQKVSSGPLSFSAVRSIYRELLSDARRSVQSTRVAFLGPQFTYTHLAAIERFGKSAVLTPVETIAAVFEEVSRGDADYGLVPIENSTDGRIVDTLDMFTRIPVRICGEVQIAVNHNLLSRSPLSEITEIYSKKQALSQCREWLNRNMSQAMRKDVASTSIAVQLALAKDGVAAVASRQASIEYGLPVVASEIQDNQDNVTRFAVIGDDELPPTGHDRTALLLQIPHKPGSLADALAVFKSNKLNLTWIESFPLRGPENGYLFFLDFEGHVRNPRTRRALEQLQQQAKRLEVLGSYPRSDPIF